MVPEVDPPVEMDVSEEMVPEDNLPDEIDGSVDRTVNLSLLYALNLWVLRTQQHEPDEAGLSPLQRDSFAK